MPIVRKVTVANGNSPEYHKISSITITESSAEITVNSWVNKEAFEEGMPLCWQERYTGPAVSSVADAELLLVAPGGIFEGGLVVETVTDVELEKVRKKMAAEEEMRKRIFEPIQVGEILLDGNQAAQDNLKNKLAEMQARINLAIETPVELLVWRDASNITHSWPDLMSYYEWLQNYTVALSTRGTMMYRNCWIHKAAIDALETVEEVRAYDIYQGWLV